AVADLAAGRFRGAAARVDHTDPELDEDLEVAEPIGVDPPSAPPFVIGAEARKIGWRLLRGSARDPGDVLDRVAEVGELPVDEGGDPAVVVHEVAGPRVSLEERRAAAVIGNVVP